MDRATLAAKRRVDLDIAADDPAGLLQPLHEGRGCAPAGPRSRPRSINHQLTKSLLCARKWFKWMQVTFLRRSKLTTPMAYYLLSSFVIGGVLGAVHWAILASGY
jgi:hypothetical protein